MGTEERLGVGHETGGRHRGPLAWWVAMAAVVLVAGAAIVLLAGTGDTPTVPPSGGDDPSVEAEPTAEGEPTVIVLTAPADAATRRCMVPNARVLGGAEVAVDAEVTEIGKGQVTLAPRRFYAGGPADEVRVAQGSASMQALLGAVGFEEGKRYLVAANDGSVMVCGFSGPHNGGLADLYTEAFDEPPE